MHLKCNEILAFPSLKVYYCRFQVIFQHAVPKLVANLPMDRFPNEQNFDLDKSRQKFHHSLKERQK